MSGGPGAPIIAGAVLASAIFFVLLTAGAAIGQSMVSIHGEKSYGGAAGYLRAFGAVRGHVDRARWHGRPVHRDGEGTRHPARSLPPGRFDGLGRDGTLPHNGAVITLLAVCGLTHVQSYKDIFAVTCIKTAAVFLVITVYYLTGIV